MTRPLFALFAICLGFPLANSDVFGQAADYRQALAGVVRQAAERILPSVVRVESIGGLRRDGDVRSEATCGLIVGPGEVITAETILGPTPETAPPTLLVVTASGQRAAAEVIARDTHRKVVLLRFSMEGLDPLPPANLAEAFTSPPELTVGQSVVAVGRTDRGEPMVSTGILSAVDRLGGTMLQIDARVSPRFYGGPVIDLLGRVLGVSIAAVGEGVAESPTEWYDSGISFAAPADLIAQKLERLRGGETLRPGKLGVVLDKSDNYTADTSVVSVRRRSPADAAGLIAGDRLTAVAGRPVVRPIDVTLALGRVDSGDEIKVAFDRDGQSRNVTLELTATIPPLTPHRMGVVIRPDDTLRVAESADGLPAAGELLADDQILRVGQSSAKDVDELRLKLWVHPPSTPLELRVRRGDAEVDLTVQPALIDASPWTAPPPGETDDPVDGEDSVWSTVPLRDPEFVNAAAIYRPQPGAFADEAAPGLLVLVLAPDVRDPAAAIEPWRDAARAAGVAVCAVASGSDAGWTPAEIDAVVKLTAAATGGAGIEPASVAISTMAALSNPSGQSAIAVKAGPADAVALAAALGGASAGRFAGLCVSREIRPPAIQLRDDDNRRVRVLVAAGDDGPPVWANALRQAGIPVQSTVELDARRLLRWVWWLRAI